MKDRESLLGQVLAINLLLITATLLAVTLGSGLDLGNAEERVQFVLLAMTIILTLLVNMLMLRKSFSPLARLIDRIEEMDPANPSELEADRGQTAEVGRLAAAFDRLLKRIDAERVRSGRLALRAQEAERKRVARDLHDEVNQSLTAILLRLEALSQEVPPEIAHELRETKALTNQAMDELLQLAKQLRPSALDDHGLVSALDSQARTFTAQTGIEADFQAPEGALDLGDDQEVVIYRVAQEALNNVSRHSSAKHVEVALAREDGTVQLRVSDDGGGFDAREARTDDPTHGFGVAGMAERARLVGGDLLLDSNPGRGTTVLLRIPLAEAEAAGAGADSDTPS